MPDHNAGAADPPPPSRRGGSAASLFVALRPRQWSKNVLLFAGLLFTADQSHPVADYLRAAAGFVLFSLLSGCAYLLNDLQDIHADRLHPKKRHRPIAAGRLSPRVARGFVAVFVPLSLVAAYFVAPALFAVAVLYFTITVAYSYRLKNVVVVDVMAVASGFVLRAIAGAAAVSVDPSVWLLLCTGLLALVLALGKRRAEIVALGEAPPTRPILAEYTVPLLDQMVTIVAAACIMAYSLYTFGSDTGRRRPYMMATIPFVLYGLFRYLYLVYRRGQGETPETIVLEDPPMRWNLLLWTITVLIALFYKGH